MKKIFETIGMISLICVSFIFTERTANVVKEVDNLMVEIKQKSSQYSEKAIDATIDNDTIIPGLNGKIVDENGSYNQMKRVGTFNDSLLKYKQLTPTVTISNNYNKYVISGNIKKKDVSLIFLVTGNTSINDILNIINNMKIKATFYIDSVWLENNNEKLLELIENGHTIGNISYNNDYKSSDFIWIDTIVKKVGKQSNGYCYTEEKNETVLNICALNRDYTIIPTLKIKTSLLKEIKKGIKNGSIISVPVNENTKAELSTTIRFITSKGYNMVGLNDLISENNK